MSKSEVDKSQHANSTFWTIEKPRYCCTGCRSAIRVQNHTNPFPLPQPVKKIEQELLKTSAPSCTGFISTSTRLQSSRSRNPCSKKLRKPSPTITDWKLTVVGYTINISGDKYNLDLSAPVRRQ